MSTNTNSLARVPCTIVTGFLGAGKTTLIRHVLANARGRRLAVIVNEFGDVGIDGAAASAEEAAVHVVEEDDYDIRSEDDAE